MILNKCQNCWAGHCLRCGQELILVQIKATHHRSETTTRGNTTGECETMCNQSTKSRRLLRWQQKKKKKRWRRPTDHRPEARCFRMLGIVSWLGTNHRFGFTLLRLGVSRACFKFHGSRKIKVNKRERRRCSIRLTAADSEVGQGHSKSGENGCYKKQTRPESLEFLL